MEYSCGREYERTGVLMFQDDVATFSYLQKLFQDHEIPSLEPVCHDRLEGSFQRFGFSFLQTILEMGQETGSLEIRDQWKSLIASLLFEKGEIVESQLNLVPFSSREEALDYLTQKTPGPYRFEFAHNEVENLLADVI